MNCAQIQSCNKLCKPFNFQSLNSVKLSFTINGGICSDFVGFESCLESKSDIWVYVRRTFKGQLALATSV